MAFFSFLQPLLDKLKTLLGPLGKLYDEVTQGVTHIKTILARAQTLVSSVVGEWNAWKSFKSDVRFKQRVIQLESAFKKTRDLITGLRDSWNAVLDLGRKIKEKLGQADTDAAVEDAEALAEEGEQAGVDLITKLLPKLAKGLERATLVVAIIVDTLENLSDALDDLQTIVDEAKRIRLEIEKLDTIFLNQGNKRRTLTLQDGTRIRVRIGHLHPP